MEEVSGFLEFLLLPVRVIDLAREQLNQMGVTFPAYLAQVLGALVFVLLCWYFATKAIENSGIVRLGSWVVVAAAAVCTLSILITLYQNHNAKLSKEIIGRLAFKETNRSPSRVRVVLLDLGRQEMGSVETDVNGRFSFDVEENYRYDPPEAIAIQKEGCEPSPSEFLIRRTHLVDEIIDYVVSCNQ